MASDLNYVFSKQFYIYIKHIKQLFSLKAKAISIRYVELIFILVDLMRLCKLKEFIRKHLTKYKKI